ncbi:hypothetical protein EZS27_041700, partial [termite gut metagenome]
NESVVEIPFHMDYLFIPVMTSRIHMESTLPFIISIHEMITMNPKVRLKSIHPFWNRMTGKEKQELFNYYEKAICELGVSIMQTRIPQSVRYDREQSIGGSDCFFLSTIFLPDRPLLKGSHWGIFMDEPLPIL